MTRAITSLLIAVASIPAVSAAQGESSATAGSTTAPSGVVVSVDVGGGGSIGAGPEYTSSSVFEAELGIGYELPFGLRPEFAIVFGVDPSGNIALRPGVHYAFPGVPFYARAAVDWSTVQRSGDWRWLLTGGGAEFRVTDVLGGFVEADVGIPLVSDVGVAVLGRAGLSLRF